MFSVRFTDACGNEVCRSDATLESYQNELNGRMTGIVRIPSFDCNGACFTQRCLPRRWNRVEIYWGDCFVNLAFVVGVQVNEMYADVAIVGLYDYLEKKIFTDTGIINAETAWNNAACGTNIPIDGLDLITEYETESHTLASILQQATIQGLLWYFDGEQIVISEDLETTDNLVYEETNPYVTTITLPFNVSFDVTNYATSAYSFGDTVSSFSEPVDECEECIAVVLDAKTNNPEKELQDYVLGVANQFDQYDVRLVEAHPCKYRVGYKARVRVRTCYDAFNRDDTIRIVRNTITNNGGLYSQTLTLSNNTTSFNINSL